jgi:hypothetical protein
MGQRIVHDRHAGSQRRLFGEFAAALVAGEAREGRVERLARQGARFSARSFA